MQFHFLGQRKVSSDLVATPAGTGLDPKLEGFIAGLLSGAPGVEQILIVADENVVHVWSIVNNLSDDQRHHVYECEGKLLDTFPDVPLDFHVVDRRDAPADGLIPGARTVFAQ
jgi:hypothetical protein